MRLPFALPAFASCVLLAGAAWSDEPAPQTAPQLSPPAWQEIARVRPGKTHVVPAFWANLPHLNAKTRLKALDVDGPGVVTLMHVSAMGGMGHSFDSPASQSLILRVYYDGEAKPSIEMPLMDFLADIQCRSAYFSTVYFSKVKESHNFRLPMPFRRHITIEVENPSDQNLAGYADIQWEKLDRLPDDCGYLRADYRTGSLDPKARNTLFDLNRPATIMAHWLQYESEKSPGGEVICEADHMIFLDGDEKPTLHYQGSEDVYGFSWGYKAVQSDGYMAILKREELKPAGSRIAVLRARAGDAIAFQKSCRWVLTFENDRGSIRHLGDSRVPYRHCVYYYEKP